MSAGRLVGMFGGIPENSVEQIKRIRQIIKKKCPTVSVRNARGTAWGWVEIRGSGDEFHMFTREEAKALYELNLLSSPDAKTNCAVIAPEDRAFVLKKWLNCLSPEDRQQHEERLKYRDY